MAKYGRISLKTADGKFNFTPDRKKGKYCVIRIFSNEHKADNHLPLKDNTSNLNPLPSCHSTGNYINEFQIQFSFALNKLVEIYQADPDAFIIYDKKKKKRVINTRLLSTLVYDNRSRSKSRNNLLTIPVRQPVNGKEVDKVNGISINETDYEIVDYTEVEKSKVELAIKINKYFGVNNSPENIIKEVGRRNQIQTIKNEFETRNKKYGDYSLITDTKKIDEIFENGDFDQTDLYLLANAITRSEKNAKEFNSVLHRFREYNLRNNTTFRTKDLTVNCIQKFILFFIDNGINDFSTIGMTPFNYRSERFKERIENGTPLSPTDETLRKFFIYLKKLVKLLNKEDYLISTSWNKDGLKRLEQIDELTNEINYGVNYSSLSWNTRQNYFLTKDEFDKIFNLKLKAVDGYTAEELTIARDMFVCMTWLGGLRPIEYTPDKVSVMKDSIGGYYVNYITSEKNKKEVANPVVGYALDTLKKYGFKIPYIKIDSLEFKTRLQLIIKQAKIDREIIKIESRGGKDKKTTVNIQQAIYPYFARHTFNQLLVDSGMSDNQIARFTGHSVPNLSIEAYSTKGINLKLKYLKEHKLI